VTKPLPDVLGPDLRVLFAGFNPGMVSFARGHHYARPGNRFWRALYESGFTPRLLSPDEDGELPDYGIGLTNVADRPTRAAADLSDEELRAGADALDRLARDTQPAAVAVVGLGAYRVGFARPLARVGLQAGDTIGGRPVWVLPNTSGLNAHYQMPALVRQFAALRTYVDSVRSGE
jgi:TDG/mug DNA glycosylase family protein